MRLKDKVAIVTGGASGTGKAICIAFAREGAQVVIVDIDKAKSKAALKDITAAGKAIALQADVTSSASVNAMANEAHRRFGRIDILVNNVGVRIVKPFLDHTDEDWNTMIATNLTGPFLCSRAVVPYMQRARRGRILNTASIASFVGRAQSSGLCLGKVRTARNDARHGDRSWRDGHHCERHCARLHQLAHECRAGAGHK